MPNLLRKSALVAIAAIAATIALPQEKPARMSGQAAKRDFAFEGLVARKSIDVAAFRIGPPPQLVAINLHVLNLAPKLAIKKSAENDPFQVPYFAKPVPNRLGDIELLRVKPDMRMGFDQSREANLSHSYVTSSKKSGMSDEK
jgi:hypothetical protein